MEESLEQETLSSFDCVLAEMTDEDLEKFIEKFYKGDNSHDTTITKTINIKNN
jgi:hypothetical protein